MEAGQTEIRNFLSSCHPFSALPDDVVEALPATIQARQAERGATILQPGQESRHLFLVRSGAVEIRSPEGQLWARMSEGEAFGVRALLGDGTARYQAVALEPSEILLLPQADFARLKEGYPTFDQFFVPSGSDRMRSFSGEQKDAEEEPAGLLTLRTADLMTRAPVTIQHDRPVQAAARLMRDRRISCLPVLDGEALVGILTSGDLRDRVVAEGYAVDGPVHAIMTPQPFALGEATPAYDALLAMTQRNISHLPVVARERLVGVITSTDLVRKQAQSAIFLVRDIYKHDSFEGLAASVAQVPQLLVNLVEAGSSAHTIGHIVTSICDAATKRLLQLAEARFGPPPVPYLWLASGSQARREQTGVSDQDNCLVLDDRYDAAEHGPYFETLAQFVSDGLNACGYVYCPGEMMATTDQWRQPLATWQRYFVSWIEEPAPMAQMLTSVLFDLRAIWGETGLLEALQDVAIEKARSNSIFLAHLVSNALTHTPPLGFFRNFVLIRGGDHKHRFDLKHSGVVPIIDIARVYALEAGVRAVNTHDRLVAEREAGVLSESGGRDLLEAFEFISILRLKHQARQIRAGDAPDNFVAPDDLSHFERNHLKDAFQIVKTIQSAMANRHQIGAR